jgi:hypothetical protein
MPITLRLPALVAAVIAACGLASALPDPAAAHGPAPSGLSEGKLRAWETRLMGRRHAAEHALQREWARDPKQRARAARELRAARRTARASADGPADQVGRWAGRFDIAGTMGINAALLATGKVMWYAYPNEPDSAPKRNESWAVLWDPTAGTGAGAFRRVDPPTDPATGKPANIWCSGTSFLADGRLLATGGNFRYIDQPGVQYAGLNHVYTFNPWSERWTRQPDMQHGRWYPTQLLMPDGRTLIIQGLDESRTGAKNDDVEVFTPSSDLDGVGSISKLGDLPGNRLGDYYPHMFWMPSGRALIAGPFREDSWFFSSPGNSVSTDDIGDLRLRRAWGTAVLDPTSPTSVLLMGGSDNSDYDNAPATNTSERFDETRAGAGFGAAPSMNVSRSHHNTVLLPDGSMVTIGGGVGNDGTRNRLWTADEEHKQVELWDPSSKSWRLGPSQAENRAYHSTAILLPDGRVVSAGDDRNGGFDRDSAEIYEPPYLHKGERPVIDQAPKGIDWGSSFDVATRDDDIAKAVLIAPGAATHAVDMNQRYVPLEVTGKSRERVSLKAPGSPNLAPPGYYMLFLVDGRGVPSEAKWVRLRSGSTEAAVEPVKPEPTPAPTAPTPVPAPVPAPPPAPPAAPVTPAPTAGRAFPRVRATIVRRGGKRVLRVALARHAAMTARVRLQLHGRRNRVHARETRTLKTGRVTYLERPRVRSTTRAASAKVVALGPNRPAVRARVVRRRGQRMLRVTIAASPVRTVRVRLLLEDRRDRIRRRATRTLRTGRTTYLERPKVISAVTSVRARVL